MWFQGMDGIPEDRDTSFFYLWILFTKEILILLFLLIYIILGEYTIALYRG